MSDAQVDVTDPVYEHLDKDPDFQQLRKSFRSFAFPVTVAFLVWYLLYVVMSAFALRQEMVNGKPVNVKTGIGEFLATPVIGDNINVALIFGLLQFASTFLIAFLYGRHARKNLDPLVHDLGIKAEKFSAVEGSPKRAPGRSKRKDSGR